MLQLTNPAWWYTLASLVLGSLGVTTTGLPVDVKTTITGVVGLVVAVYSHEHHKTVRNADTASATIAAARAGGRPPAVLPTAPAAAVPFTATRPADTVPATVPQSDHVAL